MTATRRTRRTEDPRTPRAVPARVAIVVVLAALGAITTGCGSSSSSPASALAGTWTGHCSVGTEQSEDLTTRFAANGQFSSSSVGSNGHESSGTFTLTGPNTLTITTQSGTLMYGYKLINNVLTLTTATARGIQTCNLPKQ